MSARQTFVWAFVFCFLGVAATAFAGVDRWTLTAPFGPTGTVVADLVFDPRDPSTLFAATYGGVFKSIDGGATWAPSSDGLTGVEVRALAIDPGGSGLLYAVTFDRGIFRSVDNGGSWTPANGGLPLSAYGAVPRFRTHVVALDPNAPWTVYTAVDYTLYRSIDGGANWTPIFYNGMDVVTALLVAPTEPSTLLVGVFPFLTQYGLLRSRDGGETFERLSGGGWYHGDPSYTVEALTVDPSDPMTIYAGLKIVGGVGPLIRSRDGGETFDVLLYTSDSYYVDLAVAASGPQTIYADTTYYLWRSPGGGPSWEWRQPPETLWALEVHPQIPERLFAGTDRSGVLRSDDGGDTWSASNSGLLRGSATALVVDPSSPSTVYAAVPGEGVYRSRDSGATWTLSTEGLPGPELGSRQGVHLLAHGADSQTLYGASIYRFVRSFDGGVTWTPGEALEDTVRLVPDPEVSTTVYSISYRRLYRSDDAGASWTRLTLDSYYVQHVAIHPRRTSEIVIAGGRHLRRSVDRGASWKTAGLADQDIAGLAFDPVTAALYAVTRDGMVFRERDGSQMWQEVGPIGDGVEVTALLFDPLTPAMYVGTVDHGVLRSLDGGRTWAPVAALPRAVAELAFAATTPSQIYALSNLGEVFALQPVTRTSALGLHEGRFQAEVSWRGFQGQTGDATVAVVPGASADEPVSLRSEDSAVIEFFSPTNWEMLVKVLDGRRQNGHHWVFLASATTVAFTTTVTDTACDAVRVYSNRLGEAAPAVTDTLAFPECESPRPASCVATEDTFCLGEGGRFRVKTEWTDFAGQSGTGGRVELPVPGLAQNDDSGLFFFFSPDNWELLVKVLDGCRQNGHFWVFGAATTNVEYSLSILDTESDRSWSYTNPLGKPSSAISDVQAFPCTGGVP